MTGSHVIYDYQGLKEIVNDTNGSYMIGCNIDCSESAFDNNGAGWNPIDFGGTIDGMGNYITNLYSTKGGLFNKITGNVSGIKMKNCRIEGVSNSGIFANEIDCGSNIVQRCSVDDSIILPKIKETQDYQAYVRQENLAGFAYGIRGGCVKECYTNNCVIGQQDKEMNQIYNGAAGFVVSVWMWPLITDCYSTNCKIYALNNIGGFVCYEDYFQYTTIQDTGTKRCYASNRLICRDSSGAAFLKGGFCASASGLAIERQYNCYYNTTVSGVGSAYGYGKITEQLKDIETFEGWDFSIVNDDGTIIKKTWRIEDGLSYPYLQYNKPQQEVAVLKAIKVKNEKNGDVYVPLCDIQAVENPHLFIRVV